MTVGVWNRCPAVLSRAFRLHPALARVEGHRPAIPPTLSAARHGCLYDASGSTICGRPSSRSVQADRSARLQAAQRSFGVCPSALYSAEMPPLVKISSCSFAMRFPLKPPPPPKKKTHSGFETVLFPGGDLMEPLGKVSDRSHFMDWFSSMSSMMGRGCTSATVTSLRAR